MDYIAVWLNKNNDQSNKNYQNEIEQLQQVVDSLKIFTELNKCIEFIDQLDASTKVFVIVAEDLGENIIPRIQNKSPVKSIYIHGNNDTNIRVSMQQYKKVKGVNQIENICHSLHHEIRLYENCLPNVNHISSANSSNELDQSFMYTQLLKETFLKIKDNNLAEEMKELLKFLREQYANNDFQLKLIGSFEEQYSSSSSIKYYTKENFIYSILNKALRTQNIDIILKFGFFIRDLHRQIVGLHSTNANLLPSIVYRGQGMLDTDFEKLKKKKGGLLSFNNFLSTTANKNLSEIYAESNTQADNSVGILFEIEVDRSIACSSFALLDEYSYYKEEQEILFSMNTVFRIGDMDKLDDRLWKIKLALTDDTDEKLKDVTDLFRDKMKQGSGWQQLGELMIMLDKYDKAEEIYSELKNFIDTNDWKVFALLFNQLGFIHAAKNKYSTALLFFFKTLDIEKDFLPPDHLDLAITYNNIAEVYHSMALYLNALELHEETLRIRELKLKPNDLLLAVTHNNIAFVYRSLGKYEEARSKCQRAISIAKQTSVSNQPELATIYENLATIHTLFCEYPEAISYYSEALKINEKILPPNHTSLLITYSNIISTYTSMGKYSEAIYLYEQKLDDPLTQLVKKHPSLAIAYANIGLVHLEQGDYSQASTYCEKALKIQRKTDPDHNLDLATTYNTIGHIHETKNEFNLALSSYEKTREIDERCLNPNHPNLATIYNDLGNLYRERKNYTKAYEYLHKALEIRQRFGDDHVSLASVYNNIGNCDKENEKYDTALSHYEKARSIYEKSVDSNYQNLAINYNNIGSLYYTKREYLKAQQYFQKALDIEQKYLGDKHPNLVYTRNNIAYVLEAIGQFKQTNTGLFK